LRNLFRKSFIHYRTCDRQRRLACHCPKQPADWCFHDGARRVPSRMESGRHRFAIPAISFLKFGPALRTFVPNRQGLCAAANGNRKRCQADVPQTFHHNRNDLQETRPTRCGCINGPGHRGYRRHSTTGLCVSKPRKVFETMKPAIAVALHSPLSTPAIHRARRDTDTRHECTPAPEIHDDGTITVATASFCHDFIPRAARRYAATASCRLTAPIGGPRRPSGESRGRLCWETSCQTWRGQVERGFGGNYVVRCCEGRGTSCVY
ncbi:hypothetical protein BJ546DRAFT_1113915, partial [Cryomyces antarcticus]